MTERAPTFTADAIVRLRQQPGFPQALRVAAQCSVEMYRADRLLNALMNDRARALFTLVALYLHYADEGAGAPGLTVGAMKDLCTRIGLCSRGRCEAMLAVMRAAGLFASVPNLDRRRRPLVPTERLLALHRERWEAHFTAMSAVIPEAAAYRAALDDPGFIKVFVLELGQRFIAGFRILDAAPELEKFAERNAGIMILYSLALAGRDDDAVPPRRPVPLSINALATRFSVSRKHVLTLLRDAEAEGLLVRGGPANSEITLLSRGREALEMMMASLLLYMAECAAVALRATGEIRGTSVATIGLSA
jgi:hypothetical protein